jgi:hypothetical protein
VRRLSYVVPVNVPSLEEFEDRYPQYGPFARGAGRPMFDAMVKPESFVAARIATEELDLPAVAGVATCARRIADAHLIKWSSFLKQFIGAVMCSSMEANGFKKTERKRAIPHKDFTKGEVYAKA